MRSLAGLAALFLVAAGVGGCGRFTSKKDAVPDPTVEVGGDTNLDRTRPTSGPTTTVLPSPTTPVADPLTTVPADAPGTGSVDIEVVDTEGTPRSGVAVQFDGPVRGTVVSGADGRLRFAIRAGRYQATALEGCRGQLVVERGGKADLGVAAGQTASGKLVVQVGLRFEPVAPVAYSGDAAWRVGEEHRVQLRLADVCETDGPPSPAAYVAARFASGDGVEVVAPLSGGVDPQGTVEIALRCTAPDQDVTLELADALNPRWTRPILTTALLTQQRPPFCVD